MVLEQFLTKHGTPQTDALDVLLHIRKAIIGNHLEKDRHLQNTWPVSFCWASWDKSKTIPIEETSLPFVCSLLLQKYSGSDRTEGAAAPITVWNNSQPLCFATLTQTTPVIPSGIVTITMVRIQMQHLKPDWCLFLCNLVPLFSLDLVRIQLQWEGKYPCDWLRAPIIHMLAFSVSAGSSVSLCIEEEPWMYEENWIKR